MMQVPEFDAQDTDGPFVSPLRRRIHSPDTRARVYGYLTTAPVIGDGLRSDGAWAWPQSLAAQVREQGAAPPEPLYEHLRSRHFLLPDTVPEAARPEIPVLPAEPYQEWTYLAGHRRPEAPPDRLLRVLAQPDGTVIEAMHGAGRWQRSNVLQRQSDNPAQDPRRYLEISPREASALMDRRAAHDHDRRLAEDRESEPLPGQLRLARVFDGESPTGAPWFSPSRLRIPEPVRRERLAAYLSGARLVLRADAIPDPLDPAAQQPVPLNYRTDGTWVWQEALAYYVRTRGAAPELEFLCHIEERGFALPPDIPDAVAVAAAAVARAGPLPRPARAPVAYYQQPVALGALERARGGDFWAGDSFNLDLRWGPSWALAEQFERGEPHGFEEVPESTAVSEVDKRWAAGHAAPPLD
jgi:hypothetical protein